jgi:carboxyl-terminal processing protease
MRRRIWLSSIFLSLSLSFLSVRVYDALAETTPEDSAYAKIAVFTRALQLIRQDYVDEKKIGYEELLYNALRGMLAELDPHSQFMGPQDFRAMQEDTKSEFGGLGVVVSMRDGALTIVTPMEGTPGFKAGLLPGDQILKIDGSATEKMDLSDAVQRLRGDPGEKVTLTILRPASKEIKDYVIARDVITVDSVTSAELLDRSLSGDYKVGYIRITQFNEPTAEELHKKLNALEKEGMQALILDLRYNPGGLLNSAVDVLGEFLPPNQMVVYTEGRSPSQKRVYRTPAGALHRKLPLAVLVNNGSASGSEIVAGALKDLSRAILIGETTFGKGSVQSVIQLQDGSALRLTTAKYYTPAKQVIHEKGITPNIRSTLTPEQERLLQLTRREEFLQDTEKQEIAAFSDPQLERAVDALKGVMVYAGVAPPQEKPVAPKAQAKAAAVH